MRTEIEKSIINIFSEILEIPADTVSSEQTFEELGIDSIFFIRLVVMCETQLNIQFEDKMLLLSNFPDVRTFVDYVCQRVETSHDTA